MSEKERLLRSTVPPTTLDGTIIEKRKLLRSAVPPTTLAGTTVMEGKFNELKSQEGTVPPSQKMRNKPVNVESETRTRKS